MLTVIIFIVILALIFDFINGFHDTANAIATSISTRALTPRFAIFYAAALNFLGALLSSEVAKTIGGKIADPAVVENGTIIVIASLISAISWNLITWYYGIPSSSSHTLIGSLAGAVIAGAGIGAINWQGFMQIIWTLLLSPIVAFLAGYVVMLAIKYLIVLLGNGSPSKINRFFRTFQILSAGALAFSHGGNDAQKAMGIIVFALVSGNYLDSAQIVPLWVKIAAAAAIGFGTSFGGMRIIKTVGKKIMKIQPMNGFATDLTSSLVIQTSTHLGMPLSTTHVISSAIIGTGSVIRFKAVKWGMVGTMVLTWLITIPVSVAFAFTVYKLIALLFL
jgi:PiT family inorganic phosphate transporter